MIRALLAFALALVVRPDVSHAQAVRALTRPDAEYAEPFAQVAGVRELRDGRVLVADARQKVLRLVDLARGTAVDVGRAGSGPGEYSLPIRLFAASNDSTLVYDPPNLRFLIIHPDGKPAESFRFTAGMPRAADARGHLYFEGTGIAMGPNGPTAADSAPVLRYDRTTQRADTVAWVSLARNRASLTSGSAAPGSGAAREMTVRLRARTPYAERDGWTVLPNGNVVVMRAYPYRMDVIAPNGSVARGPAVPFTPVRVGDAEKAEYRALMKSGPSAYEEPTEWPAAKPAFSSEILASPAGEVWVQRYRRAGDSIPVYDVFSAGGRLTGQVSLPPRTRVVGFGAGTMYTVRSDASGGQHLQRFDGRFRP